MKRLLGFVEDRFGFGRLLRAAFDEEIEGGARFGHFVGNALVLLLLVQAVTGTFLMFDYTPHVDGAWSSVFYIQHVVTNGWLVRGLHSWGGQAISDRARAAPRAGGVVRRVQEAERGRVLAPDRPLSPRARRADQRAAPSVGPAVVLGALRRAEHRGVRAGHRRQDLPRSSREARRSVRARSRGCSRSTSCSSPSPSRS